jgi:hypothetical protein
VKLSRGIAINSDVFVQAVLNLARWEMAMLDEGRRGLVFVACLGMHSLLKLFGSARAEWDAWFCHNMQATGNCF